MPNQNNIFVDIWSSFRALPTWIQVWMVVLLMPINMTSLFFVGEPKGIIIAILANAGLILNLPVMFKDRGFSKQMSIPHLLPWTILVILILFKRPEATGAYNIYLWVLLIANIVSLGFDFPDSLKWFKGDRAVAGRPQ